MSALPFPRRSAASAGSRPSRRAILVSPGRLELHDFDPPAPGPGELLIEVRCALSCGTDLKAWRRGHPMWPMPTPFGHEFSGVVARVGAAVRDFAAGDEVIVAPTAPCGQCFYCARGDENLCPLCIEKMALGGYADQMLLPAHIVAQSTFRKPPGLPFEQAALLDPLASVVHALDMARPARSETALIIGAGALGILHMLALRAGGIGRVVVAGRGKQRLAWAGELGADDLVDASRDDAERTVANINSGHGPDLVIECTGDLAGWEGALSKVRRGGRVVLFGGCSPGTVLSVDTRRMHYDNLTLLSPFHYRPRDVRRAVELLCDGGLDAGRVVNARRRLSELGEVFAMMERGDVLKCAVVP